MKKRVISAIVALIIVIPLIVLGGVPYYIGVGIISIIGYYEITQVFAKEKEIPLNIRIISMCTYLCLIISSIREYSFVLDHRLVILNIFACMLPLIVYDMQSTFNMLVLSENNCFYIITCYSI